MTMKGVITGSSEIHAFLLLTPYADHFYGTIIPM